MSTTPSAPDAPEPSAPDGPPTVVGWREWVALPQADVAWVKAKIDTGARSSSIHAFDLEVFDRDGHDWVRFSIHPWQKSDDDHVELSLPVLDVREVRSSNGQVEKRYAVALDVTLAGRTVTTVMTLSNRDEMGFRMLIGREALERGYLVDSSRSYAGGRPRRSVRKKNWGR
ncbi:ATP-dependent zinc protease family protein [Nocardioides hwasunensis]|uniref:ATP-dependent zinc protease n=1 Tax=Nocardioides hwasunensis TaxID=397258 RepID=A0ABR8MLS6_9ACTN|nr:ATP-dependent zinc protease [Nocardioides hwasunensis]MBD3916216.1 ATP-dependent zinc protease [Nocardioides hwasunensis]